MTTASHSRLAARPAAVLAIVLTSYLMIVLDISIVITGLPEIQESLGLSAVGLSWVQNAYMLFFGGFLLLAARAGDVFGRKRMFLSGLVLFTGTSLLIGIAPSAEVLIGARALQGMGAAILAPSVLALISTHFAEGPERTRALAYYSMVAGVGSSLGLVLGGIFADQISWRVGFVMNVPIGLVLMLAASRILEETDRKPGAFDLVGAVTSTMGMGFLVYGIIRSAEYGWSDTVTDGTISLSLVFFVIFIVNEARVRQPMLPLRLFASRERSSAYGARMLFLGAMVSFFFFTTQFMQGVLGYSPLEAGIGFLPMTLPTFVAAVLVPKLTVRFGNGGLLAMALLMTAAGMLWLGQADASASYAAGVALPMILIGFGNGFALGPLTVAGVAGVTDADAGAASGLVNVAHQLGGTLGLSVLVAVFVNAGDASLVSSDLLAHRIGVSVSWGGMFLLSATGLVLAFIVWPKMTAMRNNEQRRPQDTSGNPANTAVSHSHS